MRLWFFGAASLFAAALMMAACVLPTGLRGGSGNSIAVYTAVSEEMSTGQWHYLQPPGTNCANGSPAGFGLNPGTSPDQLVIYLNGGGACWDAPSCNLLQTAANLGQTYDAKRLGQELAPIVESGLFDREDDNFPWSEASFAFIPYCTGDLHTGNQITLYNSFGGEKPTYHLGAENIRVFLEVLSTFTPEPRQIWLIGTSAGGYGAAWHYARFQAAFPSAQIHLFADASPWVAMDDDLWKSWRTNWAMEMPPDCPRCEESPDHLIPVLLDTYPDARFAMAAHERDATLSAFVGILPREFQEDLHWFLEHRFQSENAAAFIAPGNDHETLLHLNTGLSSLDGQDLGQFLRRWARGEESAEPIQPLPPLGAQTHEDP